MSKASEFEHRISVKPLENGFLRSETKVVGEKTTTTETFHRKDPGTAPVRSREAPTRSALRDTRDFLSKRK